MLFRYHTSRLSHIMDLYLSHPLPTFNFMYDSSQPSTINHPSHQTSNISNHQRNQHHRIHEFYNPAIGIQTPLIHKMSSSNICQCFMLFNLQQYRFSQEVDTTLCSQMPCRHGSATRFAQDGSESEFTGNSES